MSIIDINDVRTSFEKEAFAVAQQNTITSLMTENETLKLKVAELEKMLIALSVRKHSILNILPEELICLEQIGSLKRKSAERELTLEETKKLDILVRNLKLIRDDGTTLVGSAESTAVMEAELVAIATNPK